MTDGSFLLIREKLTLSNGLVREVVIWKVKTTAKYPDGIRYRMALVEPLSKKILVLFDNHFPKGHHVHIRKTEGSYLYTSVNQLLLDFKRICREEREQYEGNEDSN